MRHGQIMENSVNDNPGKSHPTLSDGLWKNFHIQVSDRFRGVAVSCKCRHPYAAPSIGVWRLATRSRHNAADGSFYESILYGWSKGLWGILAVLFILVASCRVWGEEAGQVSRTHRLKILTSFSPEFYSPFIEEYRKRQPRLQLQILNKKTTAAIAEIQRGNMRKFDLFWSSSPDAFGLLKQSGHLIKTNYVPGYPPLENGLQYYGDPEGLYFHFAFSGVGIMWNADLIDRLGITAPKVWEDLVRDEYHGQVAMSTPSRSGTTHLIVESILQSMGWQQGWAFLLSLAKNFATVTARSFSVPDGVVSERFAIGLVIDFLATGKRHKELDIAFRYGRPVFLFPAGIAALNGGENIAESLGFMDFLFSVSGQRILLNPSIARLPVSESIFQDGQIPLPPLMTLIRSGQTRSYDTALSMRRYLLVNHLFDQLITYRLLERRRVWQRVLHLERVYGVKKMRMMNVRSVLDKLLNRVPIDEQESLLPRMNRLFSVDAAPEERGQRRKLLERWEAFADRTLREASHKLDDVEKILSEQDDEG